MRGNAMRILKLKSLWTRSYEILFLLLICSQTAFAFTCQSQGKSISGSGTVNVYVNLDPMLMPGQNLVVDLGKSIQCKNDLPAYYKDYIRIGEGSAYSGLLESFRGSISYYGSPYNFPMVGPSAWVAHSWGSYMPWQAVLYMKPIGAAGGVLIHSGDKIASLRLEKKNENSSSIAQTIIWNIFASNEVIVPTGGCDVSTRDTVVYLANYPGQPKPVDLSIRCAENSQNVGFYLTGETADTGNTIFSNIASEPAAKGVGVQILRNGKAISTGIGNTVPLGPLTSSLTSLNLSAAYARTEGQVTAGNVMSIIHVTFIYQ